MTEKETTAEHAYVYDAFILVILMVLRQEVLWREVNHLNKDTLKQK